MAKELNHHLVDIWVPDFWKKSDGGGVVWVVRRELQMCLQKNWIMQMIRPQEKCIKGGHYEQKVQFLWTMFLAPWNDNDFDHESVPEKMRRKTY